MTDSWMPISKITLANSTMSTLQHTYTNPHLHTPGGYSGKTNEPYTH